MSRIIGVGAALVDILAPVSEEFITSVKGDKGGMELVDDAEMTALLERLNGCSRAPGGSAANTVVGAARLGLQTRLLTKIGNDDPGEFYRTAIEDSGVDTSVFKVDPAEATGRCLSLVTPDSERTMRTRLGAAETLVPGEITVADFKDCTHAHIEGYLLFNRKLMLHVLRTARDAGCRISLDLAAPEVVRASRDLLPELLDEYVDMVFANEVEASVFAGGLHAGDALPELAEHCDLAVLKRGERGSVVRSADETVEVPACTVEAVDTTGAGDLWAAGFLFGILTGTSLLRAARIGSLLGAEAVKRMGAVIPDREWVQLKRELGLECPGTN